jgi:hypothetical protein
MANTKIIKLRRVGDTASMEISGFSFINVVGR